MKSKLTQSALFKCLKNAISSVPDHRNRNRTKHSIYDAIQVLFSNFFLQSRSLDSHVELLSQNKGKSNKRLFGIGKVASSNRIRSLIDVIETSIFADVQDAIIYNMQRSGVLKLFKPNRTKWGHLISIDGFEFFRSENITCDSCNKAEHRDGRIDYFHRALLAGLVHPSENIFLPFSQKFIVRQDGSSDTNGSLPQSI